MRLKLVKNKTYVLNPKYIDLGVYRISDSECILIDSGYKKTADHEIIPFMEKNNLSVAGILSTHGHLDHVGGNCTLKEQFNSQIAAPSYENVFGESNYNMYILRNNFRFSVAGDNYPEFKCKTDYVIDSSQEEFKLLDIPFKTIPLHGHSPFQTGFITPDNVAYLADVIISEEMLNKTKIPYIFDIDKDLESKRQLKNLDCDYYILSHEGIYEDITTLVDMNIAHVINTTDKLLDYMNKPRSFDDYTAHVMTKMSIIGSVKKVVYIQEMLRNFITYFAQSNLIDTFEENNKVMLIKKS